MLNNARQPEGRPGGGGGKTRGGPGADGGAQLRWLRRADLIGDQKSPVRWFVIGIVDE